MEELGEFVLSDKFSFASKLMKAESIDGYDWHNL